MTTLDDKNADSHCKTEIILSVTYGTAFDLCRRSVQLITDLAVLDADRKSGIIHAGKPDITHIPVALITFSLSKIAVGKTLITIADSEGDSNRNWSSPEDRYRYYERTFKTLADFIEEQAGRLEALAGSANDKGEQTLPISDKETEPEIKSLSPDPPILSSDTNLPESLVIPFPQNRKTGWSTWYLWIIIGIVLIFCGLVVEVNVVNRILSGAISFDTVSSHSHQVNTYVLLAAPVLPGILAISFGLDMRRRRAAATLTDTNPSAPTGILVGLGLFYRNPGLAAISSAIIPGLGQAYNGRSDKGVLVAFCAGGGLLFGLLPGVIFWAYAVYDAYVSAQQINRENIPAYPFQISMGIVICAIFIPCVVLTLFLFSHYGPAIALGLDFTRIRGH